MKIKDAEQLLTSHADLMRALQSASDLIDDKAASETVAGEGSRPLHEVMHRALTDARKLREQLSRPIK